ncbi:MAG: MBL fold metallo-hydrolase [Verrucomicrobiales bacterium]|nr:MBL fold metallo-hydrolase [Verrucomicrobiales bacterium]
MISIEDYLEDIVGKAMRGKRLSLDQLSDLSNVSKDSIQELLEGEYNESVISSIAPHLNLDTDSLIRAGKKSWRPEEVILDGLSIYNTQWNDMYVNSFLVWDSSSSLAAVFDTGTNCEELINDVQTRNLKIKSIFLTHTHSDHIADLPKLTSNFPDAELYTSSKEPVDGANLINCGHQFEIGILRGTAFLTNGHSIGGLTYFIKGLNRPIAIVGDALFAGSMGGGMVSYEDALRTNRQHIFSLPDDTVVCPGHGPMTSIKEEKKMNPFYPEYKN